MLHKKSIIKAIKISRGLYKICRIFNNGGKLLIISGINKNILDKFGKFTPSFSTNPPGGILPSGFDYHPDMETIQPDNYYNPYSQLPDAKTPDSQVDKYVNPDVRAKRNKRKKVVRKISELKNKRKLIRKKQPETTWDIKEPYAPLSSTFEVGTDSGLTMSNGTGDYDDGTILDSVHQYARAPFKKLPIQLNSRKHIGVKYVK